MRDIKAYKPASSSLSTGQVLQRPYSWEKGRLVLLEMADLFALDLVEKGLVTDRLTLTVGYDIENLTDPIRRQAYHGPVTTDHYGRSVPKHAHGSTDLGRHTSSAKLISKAVLALYRRITDPTLLIRRITLCANHVVGEDSVQTRDLPEQLDLFCDYQTRCRQRQQEQAMLERERAKQQAILTIKKKYGKNAILKAMDLEEGATTISRNQQIGGHSQ